MPWLALPLYRRPAVIAALVGLTAGIEVGTSSVDLSALGVREDDAYVIACTAAPFLAGALAVLLRKPLGTTLRCLMLCGTAYTLVIEAFELEGLSRISAGIGYLTLIGMLEGAIVGTGLSIASALIAGSFRFFRDAIRGIGVLLTYGKGTP